MGIWYHIFSLWRHISTAVGSYRLAVKLISNIIFLFWHSYCNKMMNIFYGGRSKRRAKCCLVVVLLEGVVCNMDGVCLPKPSTVKRLTWNKMRADLLNAFLSRLLLVLPSLVFYAFWIFGKDPTPSPNHSMTMAAFISQSILDIFRLFRYSEKISHKYYHCF